MQCQPVELSHSQTSSCWGGGLRGRPDALRVFALPNDVPGRALPTNPATKSTDVRDVVLWKTLAFLESWGFSPNVPVDKRYS